MTGKTFRIFLLVTAGFVFLAHGVIPHHHHEAHICFITDHCKTDENGSDDSDHQHSHGDDGTCVLKQELTAPPQQYRLVMQAGEPVSFTDNLNLTDNTVFQEPTASQLCAVSSLLKSQDLIKPRVSHGTSVHGLRAPPVC